MSSISHIGIDTLLWRKYMKYSIMLSPEQTYIILKLEGGITRLNILTPDEEAHALGKRLNIHRFLVDARNARNVDSLSEKFSFSKSDIKTMPGFDKTLRVAHLIDPDDTSHDFVATVAKHEGFEFKLFTDEQKAVEYLMGNF